MINLIEQLKRQSGMDNMERENKENDTQHCHNDNEHDLHIQLSKSTGIADTNHEITHLTEQERFLC
jgi:hypothetical protein